MLIRALNEIKIPVMGYLPRSVNFTLAERHLGLVQAGEHENLDIWIDLVADALQPSLDLDAILALTGPTSTKHAIKAGKPPAQKIAIAQDRAFEFTYTHTLKEWRAAGAELSFFSRSRMKLFLWALILFFYPVATQNYMLENYQRLIDLDPRYKNTL